MTTLATLTLVMAGAGGEAAELGGSETSDQDRRVAEVYPGSVALSYDDPGSLTGTSGWIA